MGCPTPIHSFFITISVAFVFLRINNGTSELKSDIDAVNYYEENLIKQSKKVKYYFFYQF